MFFNLYLKSRVVTYMLVGSLDSAVSLITYLSFDGKFKIVTCIIQSDAPVLLGLKPLTESEMAMSFSDVKRVSLIA